MTNTTHNSGHTNAHTAAQALQDRYGLRVAERLQIGTADLPHDVAERLRAAREQALAQRKQPRTVAQPARAGAWSHSGGAVSLVGGDGMGLWGYLTTALVLVLLVVGLVTIHKLQDDARVDEIASVDAALLADAVPPSAYADPGFLQFLKYGPPQ